MALIVAFLERSRTIAGAGLVLAAATWTVAVPSACANPFESLFGFGGPRYVQPQSLPPHVRSYSDPRQVPEDRRSYQDQRSHFSRGSQNVRGSVFCVRTCDGRYFPLQRLAGAAPAEVCRAFCPASKTQVYYGSRIDYAVGPNGRRYGDLDTAFAYRDRVVKDCSCNGKDEFGLARLDTLEDPTLRSGDIVATDRGFATFRGRNPRHAEFTPIDPSSSAWARQLADIKISPAPPADEIRPPGGSDAAQIVRQELRRAHVQR